MGSILTKTACLNFNWNNITFLKMIFNCVYCFIVNNSPTVNEGMPAGMICYSNTERFIMQMSQQR